MVVIGKAEGSLSHWNYFLFQAILHFCLGTGVPGHSVGIMHVSGRIMHVRPQKHACLQKHTCIEKVENKNFSHALMTMF